jgi:hypothetical protein
MGAASPARARAAAYTRFGLPRVGKISLMSVVFAAYCLVIVGGIVAAFLVAAAGA